MAKQKTQYCIKSCPTDSTEQLENLLNSMTEEGWDLYTMHEAESDDGFCFNCIFIRDAEDIPIDSDDNFDETFGYKTTMQRIIASENDPFESCIEIQRKIKDKRNKIQKIKSLIDETSEDQRFGLNEEMYNNIEELKRLRKQLKDVTSPGIMKNKIGQKKLTIRLSEEIMELVNPDTEDVNLVALTVKLRQQLADELGYIIPRIEFENSDTLLANEFSIDVRGVSAVRGRVYPEYLMYFKEELNLEKRTKDIIKDTDVISKHEVMWIPAETTKSFWAEGMDAKSVIIRALEYVCIKYADFIFDYASLNDYIDIAGNENLYLVENLIPERLTVSELKMVLTSLIKERVSIKDIIFIFEKLNDIMEENPAENPLARLRLALSRNISQSLANENNQIFAIGFSPETCKYFQEKIASVADVVHFESTKIRSIASKIEKAAGQHGIASPEILLAVPMNIRYLTYILMSKLIYNIRVIACEEAAPEFVLETLEKV